MVIRNDLLKLEVDKVIWVQRTLLLLRFLGCRGSVLILEVGICSEACCTCSSEIKAPVRLSLRRRRLSRVPTRQVRLRAGAQLRVTQLQNENVR